MKALGQIARVVFRTLLCLVLAVPLMTTSTQPAKADVLDGVAACFNTVYTPKLALTIASKLTDAQFLQCASQISSGDVVMIGISGVLSALAAGGEITSEKDCNDKINSVIGVLIAKVLLSSDQVKSVLGADAVNLLKDFVSGNGAALLSQIPALSFIFNEISCGCSVAGTTAEVKQDLIDLYEDAQECKGFVGDIGEAFLDGLESGADAAGNLLTDSICVLTGGLLLCEEDSASNEDEPNPGLSIPPCIGAMTPRSAYKNGACICNAPKAKTYSADGKSVSCTICPEGQGRNDKGLCAACPPGKKADNGYGGYGLCTIPFTCPIGSHVNAKNSGCEKSCPDGAVFDGKSCKTCGPDTYADFPSTASSAGECRNCGEGAWSYGGENVCYSKCAPYQNWVGGKCENICAPGTYKNSKDVGDLCLACASGTESNAMGTACLACPKGSTWTKLDNGGGRCACPKGSAKNDGVCKVCTSDQVWSSDATGEHCNAPVGPGGFPKAGCKEGEKRGPDGYSCIKDCGFKAVNDKQNPMQCHDCAKGEIVMLGVCMKATLATEPTPNGDFTPKGPMKISCPAGSFVSDTGNACLKREAPAPDDPAKTCAARGVNFVVTSDGTCKKCPLGKIANASRSVCILARSAPAAPQREGLPDTHISPPATRSPVIAPPVNTMPTYTKP